MGNQEIEPEKLNLIFLPCVCFDLAGHRIGMGQGYYDHSLEFSSSRPELIIIAMMINSGLEEENSKE